MVNIREIKKTDFDDAVRCIQRSVDISNRPDYPEKIIDYQLHEHYTVEWIIRTTKDKLFVVALLNEKIVGTGALKKNEIQNMFVDPDFFHQGIGKTIINYLEKYAKELGFKSTTLSSSITAINFYEILGYTKVEDEIVEWLGEKIRSITMTKQII